MTSVLHDDVTRFTSRGRQRRFEGLIRRCWLQEHKPRTQRGLGDRYQVRRDLVTRAEYIKVSRGTGIPKRTVTCSLRFTSRATPANPLAASMTVELSLPHTCEALMGLETRSSHATAHSVRSGRPDALPTELFRLGFPYVLM